MLNINSVFLCCVSWLSVISVNGFGYYKLNHNWPPQDVFQANDFCASHCDLSYLASATSVKQAITLNNLCQEHPENRQDELCWIGLVLDINSVHKNISYTWFDQTFVDENVINQFWCHDFPIYENNFKVNDTLSYVFINGSCWKNTFNKYLAIDKSICGPSRNKPFKYWVSTVGIPLFIFLIIFIYSSYLLVILVYKLYILEYNWIMEPSNKVKISAILTVLLFMISSMFGSIYFIMNIYMWTTYGMPMPRTLPPYGYPQIYWFAYYFVILLVVGAALAPICGYFNILLRLHHVCSKNEFIKRVICCNYYFYFIGFMISMLPIGFALIAFENVLPSPLPTLFAIITVSDLVYINASLLYYYIKGLHEYAQKHYFRSDAARKNQNTHMMDDKIHELMLEATRYVVLFGTVVIADIAIGVAAAITFISFHSSWIMDIICEFLGFVEFMLFLQSIYLSWKFNHKKYEKKCYYKYADRCVMKICNKIVKRRHEKTIKKLDENVYYHRL